MAAFSQAALEQNLTERNGEYDLPDDLLSSSDADDDEAPITARHRPTTTKAKEDASFPHMRKHTLTGAIKVHTQIYVVNEQIIHGKSTWSTTLCAFDSLHSANTDARTRAVLQHANGDASLVQVYYRNGYGTWTTVVDSITRSVFVNATVLQHLVAPLVTSMDERLAPGDRLVPSRVPGSKRVRQIQTFKSTDSIRAEMERPSAPLKDTRRMQTRRVQAVLRGDLARGNRPVGGTRAVEKYTILDVEEQHFPVGEGCAVPRKGSIDDLQEFASLHTLL